MFLHCVLSGALSVEGVIAHALYTGQCHETARPGQCVVGVQPRAVPRQLTESPSGHCCALLTRMSFPHRAVHVTEDPENTI